MKKLSMFFVALVVLFSGVTLVSCNKININAEENTIQVGFATTELEYNGEAQLPVIAFIKVNGEEVSQDNYSLNAINNKRVGEATAIIKMKGKYSGTIKKNFKITKKKLSIEGIVYKTREYEENNRTIILDTSNVELMGVVVGEEVILDSTNAYAETKTTNCDAGSKTVVCYGFQISGADVGNYTLVNPTKTDNLITRKNQKTPVYGEDYKVEVTHNSIKIIQLIKDDSLQYRITGTGITNSTYSKTFEYNNLIEGETYSLIAQRKSSTNYYSSSTKTISIKIPKAYVEKVDIVVENGSDKIKFNGDRLKVEKDDSNELQWDLKGYLSTVSDAQKNWFNDSRYQYFVPLRISYLGTTSVLGSNTTSIVTTPRKATIVVSDGVANVTRTFDWSGENVDEKDVGVIDLIKGVNDEMLANGSFSIQITWGDNETLTYTFDLSDLSKPSEVQASSAELVRDSLSANFDSTNISISKNSAGEYLIEGEFEPQTANQKIAFNDNNYDYYVTLYFECLSANVDWENASFKSYDIFDNGSTETLIKEMPLNNCNDTEFGLNIIKGLKKDQYGFKIEIKWNNDLTETFNFVIQNSTFIDIE